MSDAQDVTERPGENALFLVYGLKEGRNAARAVKDVCGLAGSVVKSMRGRFPHLSCSCVMGFGARAWAGLFPELGKPKELEVFREIRGERFTAVSTPGDIFFHIRAQRGDICYEIARQLGDALDGAVTPVDEVYGFRYFDGRAIIGFVDGTENPVGGEAAEFAAIGAEDPDFAGGSYVFVQKYLHDMRAWNALSTEEQEKAIGRRKFSDLELGDDEKPENAHNAVTNISDEDGNELKIVRANMPFANPGKGEFGTYFVGYARSFAITRRMLENMFVGEPRGNTDRLLDFSSAVTGTLFFAPSAGLLEELAGD